LLEPASFSYCWWSSELTKLIRNLRRARRQHKRCACAEAWQVYLEVLNIKGEAIRKARAAHFKLAVANAARGKRGSWPLAIWAITRCHLLPTATSIPNPVTPSRTARTLIEKQ
jgi:hypothetical protein